MREQQDSLAREVAALSVAVAQQARAALPPFPEPAPATASTHAGAITPDADSSPDRVIARELQGAALRHLPFLPGEIMVSTEGISIEAIAGAPEGITENMAFFVNGRRFDEVEYPIADPALQAKFGEIRGMGFVVRARVTQDLDELLGSRFLRFDASPTGHFVAANWRQAIHFMNPAFESFPLPPVPNIQRVIGDTSTTRFAMGGATIFKNLEAYLSEIGHSWCGFRRILDWGCGAGRLTRFLLSETGSRVCGVDIDADNIAWCKSAYPGGDFQVVPLQPPTQFADESFDLVTGLSVLTHLREDDQWAWLAELRRITRPRAFVFLSIQGPTQFAYNSFPPSLYAQLQETGFLDFCRDPALDGLIEDADYYRAAMHGRHYIVDNWSRYFDVVAIVDAIAALQDFVVLRRK
jgi:SAM-dependent methyltransferase